MPPESFDEGSQYGPQLDIFSFGHLALFTLTQVFPGTLLPHNYENPQNPEYLLARSEVERRRVYIQSLHGQLGEEHPLVQLVHRCLHNTPARRPSAEELLQQLETVRAQTEGGPHGQIVYINMQNVRALREKDTEIRQLQQQMHQLEVEMEAKDTQLQQMNAQLQQKNALLQQKDGQIQQQGAELQEKVLQLNRQQRELQTLRAEINARVAPIQQQPHYGGTEKLQTVQGPCCPSELTVSKWMRLADMPRAVCYPQCTAVQGVVYFREGPGGYDRHVINKYDPQTQQWTELPKYEYCDFTMTEFDNQLTVVGGQYDGKRTNKVAVYSVSKQWTYPYPQMNTRRSSPVVSSYNKRLVVAGGSDTDLDTVEILDTLGNFQWKRIHTRSLPMSCSDMTFITIQAKLFLLGGSLGKKVFSISLPALTQTGSTPAEWHTLPNALLEKSVAITVRGSLLTVGGVCEGQRSSAIHIYDCEKEVWSKVGDLHAEREDCACCLLPSGEILVAGGKDCTGSWTKQMYVAAIEDYVVVSCIPRP